MKKKVGYVRVSSKDQNLERQLKTMKELGIKEKYIYIDKVSGKDFERIGYQYMKKALEEGDIIYIHSLDRFGRNYKEIIKEWNELTQELKVDIRVLDMELLDTTRYKDTLGTFVSELVLQVLSFVADIERENIRKRQAEGIERAKANGVCLGRPKQEINQEHFNDLYTKWKKNEIKAVDCMKELGVSKATWYRRVKELEQEKI